MGLRSRLCPGGSQPLSERYPFQRSAVKLLDEVRPMAICGGRERAHLVTDKRLQRRVLAEVASEWRIAPPEELCHYCPWRTR